MAAKIFATYSLKKGKSPGPLRAFFYGLGGQPNKLDPKGQDPESRCPKGRGHITTAARLAAIRFTQDALGCCGFFLWLKQLAIGIAALRLTFIPQGLLN